MSKESVELFKSFLKKHPELINEVRNGKWTWQQLYEEWYLFGEEDDRWNDYKLRNAENLDGFSGVLSKLKQINLEEVQKNIVEVKGMLSTIQELVREFQPKQEQSAHHVNSYYRSPYKY